MKRFFSRKIHLNLHSRLQRTFIDCFHQSVFYMESYLAKAILKSLYFSQVGDCRYVFASHNNCVIWEVSWLVRVDNDATGGYFLYASSAWFPPAHVHPQLFKAPSTRCGWGEGEHLLNNITPVFFSSKRILGTPTGPFTTEVFFFRIEVDGLCPGAVARRGDSPSLREWSWPPPGPPHRGRSRVWLHSAPHYYIWSVLVKSSYFFP